MAARSTGTSFCETLAVTTGAGALSPPRPRPRPPPPGAAADVLLPQPAAAAEAETLRAFIARFSDSAASLVDRLLPRYRGRLTRGRASFRPAEIAGRRTSWRKDDSRLHVDSFPATPSGGRRILRVFTNVNPHGLARAWRIGDGFEAVARRFAPRLRMPTPGAGQLLSLLRVTKSPRTPYDA